MESLSLIDLKKKYNALLDRNSKAETYLNNHSWAECKKPLKNKDGSFKLKDGDMWVDTFDIFNDLVADLSKTKHNIETLLYRDMTEEEIWKGFKV